MFEQEFIQRMRERLEAEKLGVKQKLADLAKPEKAMDNPDMDDLANDATEDIIEESTRVAYDNLLTRIDAALARIANGTYGVCTEDDKEIPKEKLEQEPWAEHCSGTEDNQTDSQHLEELV